MDHHYLLTNLPKPDGGSYVIETDDQFGGISANVVTALSGFGYNTGIITRLGGDEAATRIESNLASYGVDTSHVDRGTDETSTFCLVLRDRDGERMTIAGGRSADNLALDSADVSYVLGADVVFTYAYTPDAVVSTLVDVVEDQPSLSLVFDLSGPLETLDGRGTSVSTIDRAASVATIFIANSHSIQSYLDAEPPDAVAILRDQGVDRGAITCGVAGAYLFDETRTVHVRAFDVDTVDTTGAGDAFVAGLIHAWLFEDWTIREVGRFAAAAGARICTNDGAQSDVLCPVRRVDSRRNTASVIDPCMTVPMTDITSI